MCCLIGSYKPPKLRPPGFYDAESHRYKAEQAAILAELNAAPEVKSTARLKKKMGKKKAVEEEEEEEEEGELAFEGDKVVYETNLSRVECDVGEMMGELSMDEKLLVVRRMEATLEEEQEELMEESDRRSKKTVKKVVAKKTSKK